MKKVKLFGLDLETDTLGTDCSITYRFGFNGQEKDDEVAGAGNIMTAQFWEYDARLGRRWNVDPVAITSLSRYACFNNSPILFIDPQGNYSKVGAWWRNLRDGGGGIYKSGNEWGYNTTQREENGNTYGILSHFGTQKYKNASNLNQVLSRSLVSNDEYINLTGNLIEKMKRDPDMKRYQKEVENQIKNDKRFGKEDFSVSLRPEVITFGGFTDNPANPFDPATINVVFNELTWVTRHATIYAYIEIQKDGAMTINYLLQDRLDLFPSTGRSLEYNAACLVTGSVYHLGLGGTASRIKATWSTEIKR